MNVGILVFDEVEVLDLGGPFEVFSVASRVAPRYLGFAGPPFQVFMVARSLEPVAARGGFQVVPRYTMESHPAIDVLIVPGGVVTQPFEHAQTIAWIARQSTQARLTASVCTGAFLLAKAGLLEGKTATTHWEDADDLQTQFPTLFVKRQVSWVDEGRVVTSAGISAGIDMSLHLVERLTGRELAEATARQMEYRWQG